jgi:hypothetical protein
VDQDAADRLAGLERAARELGEVDVERLLGDEPLLDLG